MALQSAVLAGDLARIQSVLRSVSRDELNGMNGDGFTALFLASKHDVALPMVEALLAAGAKPDARGEDDETPLYIAVFNAAYTVVAKLIGAGSDVNATNGCGKETALHVAGRHGSQQGIDILCNRNANINARDAEGRTPLFCAAAANRLEAVHLLLKRGANKALASADGKDPLFGASEAGNQGVVQLLKASTAELDAVLGIARAEARAQPPALRTAEEIAADVDEIKKAEAVHAAEAAPVIEPSGPVQAIDVPQPVVRTHDPFTGQSLGPPAKCKTLLEAGVYEQPPIPAGVVKDIPEQKARYGGTEMVVGTGSDARVVQRPMFSPADGDVFDTIKLPDGKEGAQVEKA